MIRLDGFEIKRRNETKIFFEGKELCRQYFSTNKITFGTSQLMPGERGEIDPGHSEAHEVFFVVKGTVVVGDGKGSYVELEEGDAVLILENVPHQITNISDKIALVSWSCAPKA